MGQRDAVSGQRRGVRGEPLTAFLSCDLGGLVRGRLMATADVPDRATHVCVEFGEDVSPLELFLCDAVGTDGKPWDGCPRRFLADALADLEREAALGGLVHAGLEGVRAGVDCPPILDLDPGTLTADELTAYDSGFAGYPPHPPEFLPPDEAVGAVARGQAVLFLAAANR